jgi:hypothetical protein
MYECTPNILKNFAEGNPIALIEATDSFEEVDACLTHMAVRLRTMAKKGYVNACWRFQDLPWFIEEIRVAVDILSKNGLRILVDNDEQTIKVFWD